MSLDFEMFRSDFHSEHSIRLCLHSSFVSCAHCFPRNWFCVFIGGQTNERLDDTLTHRHNTQQFTENNNEIVRFAYECIRKMQSRCEFCELEFEYQKSIHQLSSAKVFCSVASPKRRAIHINTNRLASFVSRLHKLSTEYGMGHQINEFKCLHKVQNSCQSWKWLYSWASVWEFQSLRVWKESVRLDKFSPSPSLSSMRRERRYRMAQ